jgi:hypothetical protein
VRAAAFIAMQPRVNSAGLHRMLRPNERSGLQRQSLLEIKQESGMKLESQGILRNLLPSVDIKCDHPGT